MWQSVSAQFSPNRKDSTSSQNQPVEGLVAGALDQAVCMISKEKKEFDDLQSMPTEVSAETAMACLFTFWMLLIRMILGKIPWAISVTSLLTMLLQTIVTW